MFIFFLFLGGFATSFSFLLVIIYIYLLYIIIYIFTIYLPEGNYIVIYYLWYRVLFIGYLNL
nr:MAG TPA: hypothetical protein [Caudoviricetes sp.]